MRQALQALTDELRRLKSAGVGSVVVSEEAVAALRQVVARRKVAEAEPASRPAGGEPRPVAAPVPLAQPAEQVAPRLPTVAVAALPPAPVVVLPAGDKAARWAALKQAVLDDPVCRAHVRPGKKVVLGVGSLEAKIMFVGEAPGADEDEQGEPFVGKAGQLLTKIIQAMGLQRDDVYIGNILKCRPDTPGQSAGNRKPRPDEMATCLPYLHEQIDLIRPQVLVALGATAVEGLLGKTLGITKLRGTWKTYRNIPLMPTYHPACLLRNQAMSEKRKVWEDMLAVMEKLQMPISEKQRKFFTKA